MKRTLWSMWVAVLLAGGIAAENLNAGVDMFTINLDDVVSDGVPGPGAGNIEVPGAMDVYTLTLSEPTTVYFQELTGACGIRWTAEGPMGDVLFSNNAICITNPGVRELEAGDYTITVVGSNMTTGTYSFTVLEVPPPDEFTIGLEELVADGIPGAGAGNLETAGSLDRYTLTLTAGTTIFAQELSGGCNIDWSMFDPNGVPLFETNAICITNPGTIELTESGDYTVEVCSGNSGATGTYSFIIWEVDTAQQFAIALEQEVSEGAPGMGAGNLEEAGAVDVYTFTIADPTTIFAQELSGGCNIDWALLDPNGVAIYDDGAICITNPGVRELTEAGEYTIRVDSGNTGSTGTYSFIIWEVNAPEQFTIALDQAVLEGDPGAGAGNIEEAGAIDRYLLDLPADSMICVEELSGGCNIEWTMTDPNGGEIFDDNAICVTNPGPLALADAGTYVIEVSSGNSGASGPYSFIINTGRTADISGLTCQVDVNDLLALLAAWGTPNADLDGDEMTGIGDLLVLLAEWG